MGCTDISEKRCEKSSEMTVQNLDTDAYTVHILQHVLSPHAHFDIGTASTEGTRNGALLIAERADTSATETVQHIHASEQINTVRRLKTVEDRT